MVQNIVQWSVINYVAYKVVGAWSVQGNMWGVIRV